MRILALKPHGHVLPFIHSSMVNAFRSLGIEVLDLPVPRWAKQLEALSEIILKKDGGGYQAIFTVDLGADQYFISNIKDLQLSSRIPWIIWFVDDPEGYGFPQVCESAWTIPFCWDQEISRLVSLESYWGGMPLVHLPLATDPSVFFSSQIWANRLYQNGVFVGSTAHSNEIFNKIAKVEPDFGEEIEALWMVYRQDFRQPLHALAWKRLWQKTKRPMSFMQKDPLGKLWVKACVYGVGIKKRQEMVAKIFRSGGAVFGDERWPEVVGEGIYRGRVVYGEELSRVYNESTFVLDVRQPQARSGLTQRVFDASACGVPVLTEWSPELEVLFEPGNEALSFNNIESAIEMKERFLQNAEDTWKIAEKAKQRVLAHHTYRQRAEKILKTIRQI